MARKTTITGDGIRDETVESADLASGSIKAGELSEQSISGQPTATAIDGSNDRLLIWDADGSLTGTLKQISPSVLGVVSLVFSGAQSNGMQVEVSQPSRITFADDTGLFAEETATGQMKVRIGSHFNPIAVTGQTAVTASGESVLNLAAGSNMTITTNNSTKTITFAAASGGGGGWTDDGSVVRLATSTDSVGVGTSSPQTILHVNSASNLPGEITVSIENANITANSPIGQITFSGAESSPSFAAGAHIIGEASENWSVGSAEGTALLFCTKGNGTTGDPTERMIIDHTGSVGIGITSPTSPLHVHGNLNGTYIATIDNDQSSYGHVLKLLTDGDGVHSRVLEMENGAGDIIFRARADGRFGFGQDGVDSMGAGTFVVGIDNSAHTSDIAISKRLQHLGDGDTYLEFPTNDKVDLVAGGHSFLKLDGDILINNANEDRDLKVMADNGSVVLHVDAGTNNVGIGTTSPAVPLQIDGGTDASLSNGSGYILMGAESGVNMVIDNNEIIARNNGANSPLYLNYTGGAIHLGNTAAGAGITLDVDGYTKFDKGWKYSPSVQVSSAKSTDSNLWIKMASVTNVYQSKTSTSIFLVSITGWETSTNRNISANYIVTAKFTTSTINPYYDPEGTSIVVDALDTSDLEGFDPANDIIITSTQTTSPDANNQDADIWINARVKDKHIFVTHLGGTTNVDVGQSETSFWILSGQSWQTAYTSLGNVIVGSWPEKKIKQLDVTTSATITENLTVDTDTLHVDSSNNRVGIGTASPAEELHVKGTDPRVRIEASAGNHPGVELSEDGTRKWIVYNDPANDMLRYKAVNDTNDTFSFERIADGQGQLRLTQIGYTDGAGAIDILAGGALRFNNGVKASPGVKVNSGLTNAADQWIKIATTPYPGDNSDISSSTFLITFVGKSYDDVTPQRQRYMVSARVQAKTGTPHYAPKGTDILVTPLDADYLHSFDPTTDILLAIEDDATPFSDIWIKSRQNDNDVYVTHLNGSTVDTGASDVGWEINSGESWQASAPGAPSSIVYGDWTSRKMKNIITTGAEFRTYTTAPFSSSSGYAIAALPDVTETADPTPDRIVLCNDGGSHEGAGSRAISLPMVSKSNKRVLTIKDADGSASSSNLRVTGYSSETIDGGPNHYITNDYGAVTVLCDGTEWKIISVV